MSAIPRGFTLIEMLVVIVIIAIVVGLSIPAVEKLMKSGGVSAATREVANTLSLARQCAITQRTYARVVFPYYATGSPPDMWFRTYAVMTNRDNTAAANWVYLSKWEYLPAGAVFLKMQGMNGVLNPLPGNVWPGALDNAISLNNQLLPFPTSSGPLQTLAYIEFGPTGAATSVPPNGAALSTLAITEGFMTVGSTPIPTPTSKAGNTLVNVATITADSLIGRIKVTRP